MITFLITGANRGIGFALTQEILKSGNRVLATVRRPEAVNALLPLTKDYPDRLVLHSLDVISSGSLSSLVKSLKHEKKIDVLVNNAGIMKEYDVSFDKLSVDAVAEMYRVNVIGPMMFGILKIVICLVPWKNARICIIRIEM